MIREITIVKVDQIDLPFKDINPNKLSDTKFNRLVEQIKENGFQDPIKVYTGTDGRLKLYAGEHRLQAAKVLGLEEIPAYIETYEEDKAKFELFRDNFFRGEIDPQKFTKLYDEMAQKYGEATKDLFKISDREFERLYKEMKKALPKELQKRLEEAKAEIKSIEDLSTVLNKLFSTYGNTLQYNLMIVDYGGKASIWIRVPAERWKEVVEISEYCVNNKMDINELIDSNKLLDDIKEKKRITENVIKN
jgi:ParB/RepB/Spo0J family partition protein